MKPKVRKPKVGDVYEKPWYGSTKMSYEVLKIYREERKRWDDTIPKWAGKMVAHCKTESYKGSTVVLVSSLSKKPYTLVKEGRS